VLISKGQEKENLPFFLIDALSAYFILLVNVIAFFSSWAAIHYLDGYLIINKDKSISPIGFHFFFNLFHFTMLLVAMVDNLVVLWIAVELTTIVSAILVSTRGDPDALEAAWKYIIITSTGIIFALLGTMFLANAGVSGAPMNWSELQGTAQGLQQDSVKLSFLFILVGYGTKAGLAPMFTWLPDGHGEAPSPVSAMLSGVLLKSALYAILRFYTITNLALDDNSRFTSNLLLGAGLLSLTMAVPFILKTNPFKRVLAYHSLEHMGIITFGLGIGGRVAMLGALLHALNHALTKALMFLAFGSIRVELEKRDTGQEEISGLLKTMPYTASILFLGGMALVGSPPFNVFLSEMIILWGAIENLANRNEPLRVVAICLFLASIILIFGGLVRHMARMLLGRPTPNVGRIPESILQLLPLIVLLAAILVTGVTLLPPLAQLLDHCVNIIIPEKK
jgi:hydrogenase-4 component F